MMNQKFVRMGILLDSIRLGNALDSVITVLIALVYAVARFRFKASIFRGLPSELEDADLMDGLSGGVGYIEYLGADLRCVVDHDQGA